MVMREKISLQRGMNFRVRIGCSIVLMSVRKNAQYDDQWDEENGILIYHGHDIQNRANGPDPQSVDQELTYPSGKPNENGKFYSAGKKPLLGSKHPSAYANTINYKKESGQTKVYFCWLMQMKNIETAVVYMYLCFAQFQKITIVQS